MNMSEKQKPNDGGPAFPAVDYTFSVTESKWKCRGPAGMTFRQYAAVAAMRGMCANPESPLGTANVARYAVECADALIAELEKEVGE
jgi:hypothetical protein